MGKIVSPEEFYGFKPGTDRKLIRWDKIMEYFWLLDGSSDRIKVEEVGTSTEGNPMLLTYISSPENLGNLDGIREMSWSIAHPEDLDEAEVERIISEGKSVVAMTMSIHASEVGGTQVASDFAYRLLTEEDELTKKIRDNVLLLLFPCANPDGQIMTVDWYRKNLGTEFEGCGLPWLYHKYTGHDNNRDALTLTQVETQIMNKVILKDWFPQAYIDHHQMVRHHNV
ncbi:MAG: M14 family zinc carboxypeptidase [Candidatus Bathyarchaeota archaeon]|nr:M14 family zinc carboxypeptidase [Candidatus Bathyarchaeota archaeon]